MTSSGVSRHSRGCTGTARAGRHPSRASVGYPRASAPTRMVPYRPLRSSPPFPTHPFSVLSREMDPASCFPSHPRYLSLDRCMTGTFLSRRCRLAGAWDMLQPDLPCRPTGARATRGARVMGAAQAQKAPKPRLHCELRRRIRPSRRRGALCGPAGPSPIGPTDSAATMAGHSPGRAYHQSLSFRTRHGMTGTMRRGKIA